MRRNLKKRWGAYGIVDIGAGGDWLVTSDTSRNIWIKQPNYAHVRGPSNAVRVDINKNGRVVYTTPQKDMYWYINGQSHKVGSNVDDVSISNTGKVYFISNGVAKAMWPDNLQSVYSFPELGNDNIRISGVGDVELYTIAQNLQIKHYDNGQVEVPFKGGYGYDLSAQENILGVCGTDNRYFFETYPGYNGWRKRNSISTQNVAIGSHSRKYVVDMNP